MLSWLWEFVYIECLMHTARFQIRYSGWLVSTSTFFAAERAMKSERLEVRQLLVRAHDCVVSKRKKG